jgi:hypothetical protein
MIDDVVFAVEGRPSELDVLMLAEELGPGATKGGHADLTLLFRAPSRISIGEPVVAPLAPGDRRVSALRTHFAQYEFFQVELACSFAAAAGCRFSDARFEVALSTEPPAETTAQEAIAYELSPLQLEDPQEVTASSSKPGVAVKFEPASATLTLPSHEEVRKYVGYSSVMAASGLRTSRPVWSFYRTDQREINGSHLLQMLVRKPRGSRVMAELSLRARVQFVFVGHALSPVNLAMVFRHRSATGEIAGAPRIALC